MAHKSDEEETISQFDSQHYVQSGEICFTKISNDDQFAAIHPCECRECDLEHLCQVSLLYLYHNYFQINLEHCYNL